MSGEGRDREDSQGQGEEDSGSERLVLEPGGTLLYGGEGGEDQGDPLRHPEGGGPLGEVRVSGEAGAEGGEDRETTEEVTAGARPRGRVRPEGLVSDEDYELLASDGHVPQ